ncbi:unnamed protein product [Prunus armeniaca]
MASWYELSTSSVSTQGSSWPATKSTLALLASRTNAIIGLLPASRLGSSSTRLFPTSLTSGSSAHLLCSTRAAPPTAPVMPVT